MKFEKKLVIDTTPSDLWQLVQDLESLARCIPGVQDYVGRTPTEFDAVLVQKVGQVTARFHISTALTDLEPEKHVTAITEGKDSDLQSSVTATQRFELRPVEGRTEVSITADIRITGRLATFGQQMVLSKAEQVVVETLHRVSDLLGTTASISESPGR